MRDKALVALAVALVLTPIAFTRVLDMDEGVYLYAAKAVLLGAVPYRDFVYHQMPLMPYAWALLIKLLGPSWEAARMLSVISMIALGCMLYHHLWRLTGSRRYAWLAVALLLSSNQVLLWAPLAKTHAITTALLFGAYLLAYNGWPLCAGLVSGVAVDERLLAIAAVPVLLYALWRNRPSRYLAGFSIPLLLPLAFLQMYPWQFVFCNWTYHAMRHNSEMVVAEFQQKLWVLQEILGVTGEWSTSFQYPLLVWLGVLGLVGYVHKAMPRPLALAIAAAIGFISLFPTPVFLQYYMVPVPFLIVAAVQAIAMVTSQLSESKLRQLFSGFMAILCATYLLAAPMHLSQYLPQASDPYNLTDVKAVSTEIDRLTTVGEEVWSSWPGYLVGTHAVSVHGMENTFGWTPQEDVKLEDFGMMTLHQTQELLARHRVRVVVMGALKRLWPLDRTLFQYGYRTTATVGEAEIYKLSEE